jgi:predicted acylesterase/phospholipase RssA
MEYLVLGPASMGIFAMLGGLVKHADDLSTIKEISGSSAGAILAVALALDIPFHDILDRLLALDIENLTRFTLRCFLTTYGLVDMGPIREALVACYGGGDPTFADLKRKVYVSAYCLNRARTEYFSVDTHPNMKVADAVCMSIAIPFLFSSVTHEGRVYIDGCTKEYVPVTPFVDKRPDKIMCVRLKRADHYVDEITNLKEFMHAMLTSAVQVPDTNTIRFGRVVEIDTGQLDLYDFTMSHDDKLRMYLTGCV